MNDHGLKSILQRSSLVFHSLSTCSLFLPNSFIVVSSVSLSQYSPFFKLTKFVLDRKRLVLAPVQLLTKMQQHRNLKHPSPVFPAPNSVLTMPGWRLMVLMFGYFANLQAKPAVNCTLANLDFPQVPKEEKLCQPDRSALVLSLFLLCMADDTLMMRASLDQRMSGNRRQVSRKWPKWLVAMVISTP